MVGRALIGTPLVAARYNDMSWMPNLDHRAAVDRSALGDTMLSILRRALVLVGVEDCR